MPFWVNTLGGPGYIVLDGSPDSLTERGRQSWGNFRQLWTQRIFSQLSGGLWRICSYERLGGMSATAELSCINAVKIITAKRGDVYSGLCIGDKISPVEARPLLSPPIVHASQRLWLAASGRRRFQLLLQTGQSVRATPGGIECIRWWLVRSIIRASVRSVTRLHGRLQCANTVERIEVLPRWRLLESPETLNWMKVSIPLRYGEFGCGCR